MPGKSRQAKARQALAKKRKEQVQPPMMGSAQPAAAQVSSPASPGQRVAPRAYASKASIPPHYPFVGAELTRIAILTAVILVILFVLAQVLPRV